MVKLKPPIKAKLYRHQAEAANLAMRSLFSGQSRGFGLFFEMGCGKTLTAIAIVGGGFLCGWIKRVLIVAPSSVCPVWRGELARFADFPYWLAGKAELKKLTLPKNALAVVVINYESVWRDGVFDALKNFAPDLIIADESQRIKSPRAKQSRAMHVLGDRASFKLILSGTPIQNSAVDLYSQYRFLDPAVFGRSFWNFKRRYCVFGGYGKKEIVRYQNLDELSRKESSIAFRITKAECLDLPEQVFYNRTVELSEDAREIYDQLRRDSIAELDNSVITATTILTKVLRLQQLTGGFLKPDDASAETLVSRAKLNALDDILQDCAVDGGKKLVVFARFLPEIEAIETLCAKLRLGYVTMNGETKRRDDVVEKFQHDPNVMVFVGQIATAGTGITLTAADTCVFYSLSFNYADYVQAVSRIHRIGQANKCTYIHIVAQDTVDETILDALSKKENLARRILDTWRQVI